MMYLGTLGRMVGIKCPTSQRVASAERYSFMTTLGGTVKSQAGPPARRTWDISTGKLTTPSDVGVLMDFTSGLWGPGPFWFVSADAPVVNLLPPEVGACGQEAVQPSFDVDVLGFPHLDLGDDGVAARSVWTTGTGEVRFGGTVPVIPGTSVTGSAWVLGPAAVRIRFVNASGTTLHVETSSTGSDSYAKRLSVTAVPPPTAAGVQLSTVGALTQAARPVVTWTDQPYEWGDGQGCSKAVVHNAARDVVKAWDNPRTGRWSDLSFTVQEIG